MKNIILKISILLLLSSCASSEESWHEGARKIGARSLYVHKDGTKTSGEEWYANHKEEDKKFKEKNGNKKINSVNSSQVFIGFE